METIFEVYTDGSCWPNPGKGSYAYVVLKDERLHHKASQSVMNTTNNKMELQAILSSLEYFQQPTKIKIYSDSLYAINSALKKFNGAKNKDLIKKIRDFNQYHSVEYKWVRGHSGIYWNEFVDNLAERARINS